MRHLQPAVERLAHAVRSLADELKRSGGNAWIAYDSIATTLATVRTLAHAVEVGSRLGGGGRVRVRNFSAEFRPEHIELYNAAFDAWEELAAIARERDEMGRSGSAEDPWSYARAYVREIRGDAVVVVCPYREFQALLCARGARRRVDDASNEFLLRLRARDDLPNVLVGLIDMGFAFLRDARGAASPAGIVEELWARGFAEDFVELVRHADGTSTARHRVPPSGPATPNAN